MVKLKSTQNFCFKNHFHRRKDHLRFDKMTASWAAATFWLLSAILANFYDFLIPGIFENKNSLYVGQIEQSPIAFLMVKLKKKFKNCNFVQILVNAIPTPSLEVKVVATIIKRHKGRRRLFKNSLK